MAGHGGMGRERRSIERGVRHTPRVRGAQPAERAHVAAPLARDHHILQQAERVEQRHAQRADMHPGARLQLEILGHPPVEGEAEFGAAGIDEARGIAGAIKAFLVERCCGRRVIAEIARRDGQSLDPDFQPVADRRQFHDVVGEGQADGAGTLERACDDGRALRLGRAIFGDHGNAPPGRGDGERLQPPEHILGQPRRAVAEEFEVAEEMVAQPVVGLHRADQFGKEDRRRIIFGQMDFAEVADRLGELSRQRAAVVDIEAGRLVQHVGGQDIIAADMAPRHPRQESAGVRVMVGRFVHRLMLGDDAGQDALRLDHALRLAGRARGKDGLGVGVGGDCRDRGVDRIGRRRREQAGERDRLAAGRGLVGDENEVGLFAQRAHRGQEAAPVVGVDQARAADREAMAQPRIIAARERIIDRYRRIRRAGHLRREVDDHMVGTPARQHHHRCIGADSAVEERLRQRARLAQRVAVAQPPPAAGRSVRQQLAPRDEGTIGKAPRAVGEQVRYRRPRVGQVVPRRDERGSVAAEFEPAAVRLEGQGGIIHHHPMLCAAARIKPLRAVS